MTAIWFTMLFSLLKMGNSEWQHEEITGQQPKGERTVPEKLFEDWAKATFGNNTIDDTPRYKTLPYLTDLKMAYNAGFREASDKAATLPMRAMYDAGYEQGVAAERERCAGIADEYHQRDPVHFIANAIAAAIRRGE